MPAGKMDSGAAAAAVDKIAEAVPPDTVFGKMAAGSMDADVAVILGRMAVVGRMAAVGVVTILAAEPRLPPPPAVNSEGLSE